MCGREPGGAARRARTTCDSRKATIIAKATPSAIGQKKNCPEPGITPRGPAPAACTGWRPAPAWPLRCCPGRPLRATVAPSPRCRWVFSRQMIAVSTSGPMARDSPASVITLIVLAAVVQADDRRQDRDRDGQHGDDRHPPFAQEEQDHQASRARPPARLPPTRLSIEWRT